jgi:hypothetical protein
VNTFEGEAWPAIVPFYMRGIRPRFCPPVPGINNFLELDVRTYVYDEQSCPSVWFYSLDCNQSLAVWTARTLFYLPYQHVRMQASTQVDYLCQHQSAIDKSCYYYRIHEQTHLAKPGSLEFLGSPDRAVGANTNDAQRERWRPSDALASGADGGCLAAPGSPGQSGLRPALRALWTLLARETEGPLGPSAGQAVGPDMLYCIASPPLHVAANSTQDSGKSAT